MKHIFLLSFPFFFCAGVVLAAPDILIEDFEGEDYGAWKTTGLAFGKAPAQGTLAGQMHVSGFEGKGLVNTFLGGDVSTGTLTSPAFTIERPWMNFLIGGGGHKGRTCINLIVDEKIVRSATGDNAVRGGTEALAAASWHVEALIGKEAVIEIVDRHNGGWGHINVDHIVLSETPTQADARPITSVKPEPKPKPKPFIAANHAKQMREGIALFDEKIATILTENCVECHGGKKVKGDLDLATRAGLLKGGSLGPTVILGHGAESLLVHVSAHTEEPYMPERGDPLTSEQVETLQKWITLGAPYSRPLVENPRTVVDLSRVTEEDRNFWSFQPLRKDFGERDSIDAFVVEKIVEKDLSFGLVTDPATLLTRISLDLTGLPPTAAELSAYLNDDSPEAWSRVIDRLLASPHYGERWARHWMDLARYADSGGFENDNDRKHAWPYRDYLIKSFNRNQPYDEFVHWQLAGDEFAPDNHLAWQATGFLAAGVHNGQLTEREAEPERYDVIDDWVNTTGNAFLGLSLGCARCHDHKFDPVPAADYYAMASIFATATRRYENVMLPMTWKDANNIIAYGDRIEGAVERLHVHEQDLLEQPTKKNLEASDAPGWVFLTPNFMEGLGSPSTDNPNPMHRTRITVEEVELGTFQATYVNGGLAGLRLAFLSPLKDIRGVAIEILPDLENPNAGLGMNVDGQFNMHRISVHATPIRDSVPGRQTNLKLERHKSTTGSMTFGGQERQALFYGWSTLPDSDGPNAADSYRFTVTLPCRYESPEGRPSIGKVRIKFLHGIDERPFFEPAVDVEHLAEGLSNPRPSEEARLAVAAINNPRWLEIGGELQRLRDQIPPAPFQTSLVVTEGKTPAHWKTQSINFWENVHVLRRGSPANKVGLAEPGFLQVVSIDDAHLYEKWKTPSLNPLSSGRRSALARWITNTETGAGRLTARVMVNRVWQHHFGQGLVASSSDFGAQGTRPSHPELLDWLARKFIDSGWDVKALHRLILTSETWKQSSGQRPAEMTVDPDNALLWRYPQRRLEAEVIRDRMLQVSGLLDTTMYGPGTLDEGMTRRSIYFEVKRSALIPMMAQLNWPDTLASLDRRPLTTVAPQALLMINHPQVRRYSEAFATRVTQQKPKGVEAQIKQVYQLALLRSPTPAELETAKQFLAQQQKSYQDARASNPSFTALADFCQAVFSLNEFHFTR